jgi:hypothetical protein
VASAELIDLAAQWDAEGMGHAMPGVDRAARVAGFEVDQDRAGQAGEFGELVVGEALVRPQSGQFVSERFVVRLRRLAARGSRDQPLAVNDP